METPSKTLDSVITDAQPEPRVIRRRNAAKAREFALRYAQRVKIVKIV